MKEVKQQLKLAGAASAMRDHLIPLPVHYDLKEKLIDNCGTGGDHSNSFNILQQFLYYLLLVDVMLQNMGIEVHANLEVQICLKLLGINLNLNLENSAKILEETGFTFMFAQNHHPAMKYIMPIRKSIHIEQFSIF